MIFAPLLVFLHALLPCLSAANDPLFLPSTAPAEDIWPYPSGRAPGLFLGDIRAKVRVGASAIQAGVATGTVWWRRRDPDFRTTSVAVTDANGTWIDDVRVLHTSGDCGVISFATNATTNTPSDGFYYIYWLPHFQSGGGANLHFSWFNCTQHSRACVLEKFLESDRLEGDGDPADACRALDARSNENSAASFQVVAFQNRPDPPCSTDHAPSGESFHGFTQMEFAATKRETSQFLAMAAKDRGLYFLETRENALRMFDLPPARWLKRGKEMLTLDAKARVGEYFTFQIGVYAPTSATGNLTVTASKSFPFDDFGCFNTDGVGTDGLPFSKNFSVSKGRLGSMWMHIDIPSSALPGKYLLELTVHDSSAAAATLFVNLTVGMPSSGQPLADHGDSNVYNFTRLRWLNSRVAIDDEVCKPFTPIGVKPIAGGAFAIELVNKKIVVGPSGFFTDVVTSRTVLRRGVKQLQNFSVLSEGMKPEIIVDGKALDFEVKERAKISSHSAKSVSWTSVLLFRNGISLNVSGTTDFDSYTEFSMVISAPSSVYVDDVRLIAPLRKETAKFLVGMGAEGRSYQDLVWRWDNSSGHGNCMVWMGKPEAGFFLKLKGGGDEWNNPQFSKDYPALPFIPESWGQGVPGKYGANISNFTISVFSGPRRLSANQKESFMFDVAFTPSKPLNLSAHWDQRNFQVGYGTAYMSPQAMKEMGVSVVTLHQGIPGIINGSLVNPYINYPFNTRDTVAFLENYTAQAHALGLQVKYYYTIRELSNHATELFALKALDGEIITDSDPFAEPQDGYCHDWDCHGGDIWLHEHVVDDYDYCWQQNLANGDWDAAVCNKGASRWFNYYVKGLEWSATNAPHIDGIYYDGINFDRKSFQRIRKILDRAAASRGRLPGQIDIHTGEVATAPSAVRYLSHFAYAQKAWNGEGFDFSQNRDYWLVDVSGLQHGITADRLGGSGSGNDIKGMLFGMTQRNSGTAPALWNLFDSFEIRDCEMIGWWEDDAPVVAVPSSSSASACNPNDFAASSFLKFGDRALIVIASFCASDAQISIRIDWDALGLVRKTQGSAPAIPGIQSARTVPLDKNILVKANTGIIMQV